METFVSLGPKSVELIWQVGTKGTSLVYAT